MRADRRRRRALRAGLMLPQAAARAYRRHGFAEARLITDWSAVVGERLAGVCSPERLSRDGVLTVRAEPAFAVELQHLEPQLLERIAGFFGHRAVTRLKLRQDEFRRASEPGARSPRPLNAAERRRLERILCSVENDDLRAALERLGRAVLGAQPPRAGE